MAKVTNKQCGISGATIKLELKQVINIKPLAKKEKRKKKKKKLSLSNQAQGVYLRP